MKTRGGRQFTSWINRAPGRGTARTGPGQTCASFTKTTATIDVEIKNVRRERTEKGPMIITDRDCRRPTISRAQADRFRLPGGQRTRIRLLLKMKEGSVYSPKQLRDDAKAIADAYGSGGYVDLVILPEGAPAGPAQIDVGYNIEEGNRSFVNRVNIQGNTRTKDRLIRREVLVAPGDVFNTVRVDITKKRLETWVTSQKSRLIRRHGHTGPQRSGHSGAGKTDRLTQFRRRVQHSG